MLLGTYSVKLASNHRTSIPSPLRKDLGQDLIIAKWYEECLVLVSKQSLNALLDRVIGTDNLITSPVRGSEHFIFTGAFEIIGDDQGRIVIPEVLIKYGHLGEDIYFLGIGDRVEVWNKDIWDERLEKITKDAPDYIDQILKTK
ncbi:MAG: MraZ protein [uncultured bacterium]|nr:MAG: MraZ protein [uncultured bacterium]